MAATLQLHALNIGSLAHSNIPEEVWPRCLYHDRRVATQSLPPRTFYMVWQDPLIYEFDVLLESAQSEHD